MQQWKFKAQAIPAAQSHHNQYLQAQGHVNGSGNGNGNGNGHGHGADGLPPSFRRKRRHSEPHLQVEITKAYKNYVTHWKLPTTTTANTNSNSNPTNTTNTTTNTNTNTNANTNTAGASTSTTNSQRHAATEKETEHTPTPTTHTHTHPHPHSHIPSHKLHEGDNRHRKDGTRSPSHIHSHSSQPHASHPPPPLILSQHATPPSPHKVWKPSARSPTVSPSPIITITSPKTSSPTPNSPISMGEGQWKPSASDSLKSRFHPYKRDPPSPSSPASPVSPFTPPSSIGNHTKQLVPNWDKRRNSAPHISYSANRSSTSKISLLQRENRLETIPELSFPSHSHSPQTNALSSRSSPTGSPSRHLQGTAGPPPSRSTQPDGKTNINMSIYNPFPAQAFQEYKFPPPNSSSNTSGPDRPKKYQEIPPISGPFISGEKSPISSTQLPSIHSLFKDGDNQQFNSGDASNEEPDDGADVPVTARNTRRRMSVDNLLA